VPDTAICPICQKAGFVRFETVITGDTSHRVGYCGACDNSWPVTDHGRLKRSVWRDGRPRHPSRPPRWHLSRRRRSTRDGRDAER